MNSCRNIFISDNINSFPVNKTLVFQFKANSLFLSVILIFTSVVPSSFTKSDILSMSLIDLILNTISLTGLLKRSLRDAIF